MSENSLNGNYIPKIKVDWKNESAKSDYQKQYYANNKKMILLKSQIREPCEICNRVVAKMYMSKHHKTKLCKNSSKLNELLADKN